MTKSKVNRNLNIEVLRIVAMFMIIAGHAITHTNILENISGYNFYIIKFFEIVFNVGVNIYVLISGYLLCDKQFKFKKIILLWLQIFFYSTLIYFVLVILGQINFEIREFANVLLPISGNRYWFARVYLGLYLLSPFLNILINNMNKKQHQYLLIVCTVLFSLWRSFIPFATTLNVEGGNSIIWFCVLYVFAAYIKRYGILCCKTKILIVFTFCCYLIAYFSAIFIETISQKMGFGGKGASLFTTYTSFPMLFGAVGSLCIFLNSPQIKKFSKIILWFSLSSFSVYLIHDNPYLRDIIWDLFKINEIANKIYIAPYILLIAIIIFAICTLLDKILFTQINKIISKIKISRLDEKVNFYLYE